MSKVKFGLEIALYWEVLLSVVKTGFACIELWPDCTVCMHSTFWKDFLTQCVECAAGKGCGVCSGVVNLAGSYKGDIRETLEAFAPSLGYSVRVWGRAFANLHTSIRRISKKLLFCRLYEGPLLPHTIWGELLSCARRKPCICALYH